MAEPKKTAAVPKRGRYSDDDANVLSTYLREINQISLLTREEEDYHSRRALQGDEESKSVLARANLRFVVNVAKRYRNQGLPLSDLISEGNIGLINAIERFDPDKGYHFISYAVWWIRQSILQALAEQSRIVRLPLNKIGSINKINKASARLEQGFEREPNVKEIAGELDMTETEVKESMRNAGRHVSMDAPLIQDEDNTMYDVLRGEDSSTPETGLLYESLRKEIDRAVSTLTQREADVVKLYFGLNATHPMTLEEIGEKFDLTRERVRQIKEKAIRRLKHTSRSKILKSYLG